MDAAASHNPDPRTRNLRATVRLCAPTYGLSVKLIAAIVAVESAGHIGAIRFEPDYRYLWDVAAKKPFRKITPDEMTLDRAPADFTAIPGESASTEWVMQQASWGPMQVMGAVARELGFRRPFGALCDAYVGVQFGCEFLLLLSHRYGKEFGWGGVVAAYNAGSPRRADTGNWINQSYVNAVAGRGGFDGLKS